MKPKDEAENKPLPVLEVSMLNQSPESTTRVNETKEVAGVSVKSITREKLIRKLLSKDNRQLIPQYETIILAESVRYGEQRRRQGFQRFRGKRILRESRAKRGRAKFRSYFVNGKGTVSAR